MTQDQALTIMKTGVNVYLSGSAGSGKTYLLNKYIKWLHEHNISVAVTASTGIAATHMGGMTIHGFSGVGIKDSLTDYEIDALTQKSYLAKRFNDTQVLIIDEVSMLHAKTLDMVERVARAFKRNELPFGGMQVILSGDFFQLPPISKRNNFNSDDNQDVEEIKKDFVFYSNAWQAMKPAVCYLTEQHRQEDDLYTNILNNIREGNVFEENFSHIESRLNAELPKDVLPTKLYTHNVDVDTINLLELKKIAGGERKFDMYTRGRENLVESLKKSCLASSELRLKVGAKVMFVKNNNEAGYVNGTQGTVIDFAVNDNPVVMTTDGREIEVSHESWMIDEEGKIKAEISQYPIRLAWAITIHKSQGMSLDYAEIDLSKTFTYGMGYVALSRLRTLAGLRLVGFNAESLNMDPRVLELDEHLQIESDENIELFGRLSEEEYKKMTNSFIARVGGTIESGYKPKPEKIPTATVTQKFLEEKKSIAEIAETRNLTMGTIIGHIEQLKQKNPELDIEYLRPADSIIKLISKHIPKSDGKLSYLKTMLKKDGLDLSFEDIRLARAFVHN
jgi:ATP-dependent exoDNAse (exonuclease V) alpha subunit